MTEGEKQRKMILSLSQSVGLAAPSSEGAEDMCLVASAVVMIAMHLILVDDFN